MRHVSMIACMAGATALAGPPQARASDFPDRPIQLVVPFAAGGGLDTNARHFAQAFAQALGQPVAVVNREGAAGAIGLQSVASARPDGYVLAFTPAVSLTSEPHRIKTIGYRLDSFAPVCQVFDNIFGIAVKADAPHRRAQDLIDAARAAPGTLSYGTSGTGSIPHLGTSDIEAETGVQLNHVPYKGDGPMLQDLLAGRLDFGAVLTSSISAQVGAGALRLLAVYADQRHPGFPDVPTLGEAGIAVVQRSFGGLVAPADIPREVMTKLEHACRAAVESPAYVQGAQRASQLVSFRDGAAFGKLLQEDSAQKAATLKRLGL